MEKPTYAPNVFGEIMAECWKMDPKERPTFNRLEEIIGRHLESSVCAYYLNLNDPYAKLNEKKASTSCIDTFQIAT